MHCLGCCVPERGIGSQLAASLLAGPLFDFSNQRARRSAAISCRSPGSTDPGHKRERSDDQSGSKQLPGGLIFIAGLPVTLAAIRYSRKESEGKPDRGRNGLDQEDLAAGGYGAIQAGEQHTTICRIRRVARSTDREEVWF